MPSKPKKDQVERLNKILLASENDSRQRALRLWLTELHDGYGKPRAHMKARAQELGISATAMAWAADWLGVQQSGKQVWIDGALLICLRRLAQEGSTPPWRLLALY